MLISRFLRPGDLCKVEQCGSQLYRLLHTQRNYKMLFEGRWGKTGFGLQERDWLKLYQRKAREGALSE